MYLGYLFALTSPFLDSLLNYLDKFLLTKHKINPIILTIYSGFFAFFTGLLILLFTGFHPIDIKTAIIITISGFSSIFILLTYFKALTLDETSRVASLFQFIPVIVFFLSLVFLKETLSLQQYIGCFLIVIAGFLFTLHQVRKKIFKINKSFWYMILASFFSAIVYISFKLGVKSISFWGALPYEGLGNFLAAGSIILYGNNFDELKKETKNISKRVFTYLLINEFIYRLSRYSFYFALLLIPASVVSILQGSQPFFLLIEGIILSLWFSKTIKEKVDKKTLGIKMFAIIMIFSGLYLIFK